jgi:glucoamylase
MEIFQVARPISAMRQGSTLRIMDAERFRVVWSADNWATKSATDAKVIGRPGAFVDIAVGAQQTGSIVFTLYWPAQDRWLGRNYEVAIMAEAMEQGTAAEKPMV